MNHGVHSAAANRDLKRLTQGEIQRLIVRLNGI
jgi:hypothetical protein